MSTSARALEVDRAQLAAVARLHYLDGATKVEIGEQLGISRFKVARLLELARAEGVVTITINDLGLQDHKLSEQLAEHLGLERCIVIRSHGDPDNMRSQLGAAAADLLGSTLETDEVIGLTWGRTLTATARQLTSLPRSTLVQLTGSVTGELSSSPIEILRPASQRSGGAVYPIFSPLIVEDRQTASSLRQHVDIRGAFELFASVTTAVTSVGSWNPASSQVRDVMPPADLRRAEELGCVADISGILMRADGEPVDPEFQERCVSISLADFQAVPRVIAVAGGAEKVTAIKAVTCQDLVTELVTDHHLAKALLGAAQ